jgi:biotin operon repressor
MTPADLLSILSRHVGRDKGIAADTLAELLGVAPRQVRTHVSALRGDGVAVCGTPETGYYIAATAEELDETCQFLRHRAMHSLTLESRLRNIPMPDLIGQLHLNT